MSVPRTTYAEKKKKKIQPPIDKIRKISDWLDLPLEKLMNIQYTDYAELDNKNEIVNALDDIATEVKLLKLKDQEKHLIINLLDYIAQNYIRKERAVGND